MLSLSGMVSTAIGITRMSKHKNYSLFNREKQPEVGDVIQIKTSLGGWSGPMLVVSRRKGGHGDEIIELLDSTGEIIEILPTSSICNIHTVSKKVE